MAVRKETAEADIFHRMFRRSWEIARATAVTNRRPHRALCRRERRREPRGCICFKRAQLAGDGDGIARADFAVRAFTRAVERRAEALGRARFFNFFRERVSRRIDGRRSD